MNSPPAGAGDLRQTAQVFAKALNEHLSLRLEEVAASREKVTPEPMFQTQDVEQCYQWICTELRKRFKPQEAEKLRMGITETDYWEREAQHYKDAANDQIWRNVLDIYELNRMSTADGWRRVTEYYQTILRDNGLSSRQVKEIRLSIGTQRYWQYEAELYQPLSELREHEIRERWKTREAKQKRQTQSEPSARRQPRARRSIAEPRQGDRVSDRTRFKTRRRNGETQSTRSQVRR